MEFTVKDTFLEMYEKGLQDPVYFARYFLDFDPHVGQILWLRNGLYAKERTLACANRWGKTRVAAVKLLWRTFYQIRQLQDPKKAYDYAGRLKPYRALSLAMSLDQAMISWNLASSLANLSSVFKPFIFDEKNTPFPVLYIGHKTTRQDRVIGELWARSTAKRAKFILGHDFNFINYDEAAWDMDGAVIMGEVIRMRLADQAGDIDFTSTPHGKVNWYYEQFMKHMKDPYDKRYYSQTGASFENPYLDPVGLETARSGMTDEEILQNIFGEFVDITSIFPMDEIMRCYQNQDISLPIMPNYEIYEQQIGNDDSVQQVRPITSNVKAQYAIGVDLARKQDYTCIVVLRTDINPWQMVSFDYFTGFDDWDTVYRRVKELQLAYNNADCVVDSTGLGDVILTTMHSQPWNIRAEGFNFSGSKQKKENLIMRLRLAIQRRQLVFPYLSTLVDQLSFYQIDDKKLSTDAVMGLALAVHCAAYYQWTGIEMTPNPVTLISKIPDFFGMASNLVSNKKDRNIIAASDFVKTETGPQEIDYRVTPSDYDQEEIDFRIARLTGQSPKADIIKDKVVGNVAVG